MVSGLDALRVGDPAGEIAFRVRQSSGCYRNAAADMSEIRRHTASRRGSADRMAENAGIVQEDLLAMLRIRIRRSNGGLHLCIPPCFELGLWFGDDPQSHMGVLHAAELGALPAEAPGAIGFNPFGCDTGRNEIALAV